jgi:hypothetical protein
MKHYIAPLDMEVLEVVPEICGARLLVSWRSLCGYAD